MTDGTTEIKAVNITREDVVEALSYLKEKGLTQEQLAPLHHFCWRVPQGQSYEELIEYFSSDERREIAPGGRGKTNREFGARLAFVKRGIEDLEGRNALHDPRLQAKQLIDEALEEWPRRDPV